MDRPVKILQFGDGVFLRAFLDWMVQRMNTRGLFDGSVAIVKPRPGDFSPAYARQGNEFTVSLKGILGGERIETRERVSAVSRLVNPHADFEAYLEEARNPHLACVVSNTTESGISPSPGDRVDDRPAPSYPGKLTQLLRARYLHFGGDAAKGIVIIPCELVERNAALLRELVLGHAARWYADPSFEAWLRGANTWVDSLVDRIVTGFTETEKAAILAAEGFEDDLVAVAEPYHLLALQGPASLETVLPLRKAGLNVVWADDISPWRELKVRLLNGSHMLLALAGLAMGKRTVLECVGEPLLVEAVRAYQLRETIPTMAAGFPGLPIEASEAERYLEGVLERFSNPDLAHKLEGIAAKSVAKYAARILPTVRGRLAATGKAPAMAAFILAALAARYGSGAAIQDEPAVVSWFEARGAALQAGGERAAAVLREALGPSGPWAAYLDSGSAADRALAEALAARAAEIHASILACGMANALRDTISSGE